MRHYRRAYGFRRRITRTLASTANMAATWLCAEFGRAGNLKTKDRCFSAPFPDCSL